MSHEKPVVGITIGDYNGIGPEVIIKTLMDTRVSNMATFVIYGSTKILSYYRKNFKMESFNYSKINNARTLIPRKINVINCWEDNVEIKAGQISEEAGKAAYMSLKRAAQDMKEQALDAIVTAPINKKNIQNEEFNFSGHTEFFADRFGISNCLMMMVSSNLKVGVVTAHVPLKDVAQNITKERLQEKIKIMSTSLRNDFGILKPKIAILGLNPHAGEEGMMGKEEEEIIIPVIQDFKNQGKLVYGPYPADGFFGSGQFQNFHGILAMYHDQGLIPFKTLAFESGINFTAGLPLIRTSPDHGTAYDIAGKNLADPTSFRESVFLATDILKMRNEFTQPTPVEEPHS